MVVGCCGATAFVLGAHWWIAFPLAVTWITSLCASRHWWRLEAPTKALGLDIPFIPCSQTLESCPALHTWLKVSGDLLLIMSNNKTDATMVRVGPGFQRDLGWLPEELRGHSWMEFVHPEDIPVTEQQMAAPQTSGILQVTNRWRHKQSMLDGSIRWVWLEWSVISMGDPSLVYAHARNLTNRFEREAQMATWSHITSDLMCVADTAIPIKDRRLEWVNEAWTLHLGWSISEIYEMPLVKLLEPSGQASEALQQETEQDFPFLLDAPITCRIRCKGGQYQTYEWSSVSLNGKIYSAGRNIDREIHHRDEIQQVIQDLEARNMDLERFASVSAHQLRSPPRTIAGIAQALEEDYGHLLDDAGLQFLTDIRNDADQMAEIVDGLYRFSKVRTSADMPLEPVDLCTLMLEIQGSERKRGVLQMHDRLVWKNLPAVLGDKVLLLEVFRNLVDNALKFNTSAQKVVEVSVSPRDDGRWQIQVKDNGIGIDPKYQGKIFTMFQRVHPGYKGTGVGLALVAAIIQKLGGSITVQSDVSKGSTFTFDLEPAWIR